MGKEVLGDTGEEVPERYTGGRLWEIRRRETLEDTGEKDNET